MTSEHLTQNYDIQLTQPKIKRLIVGGRDAKAPPKSLNFNYVKKVNSFNDIKTENSKEFSNSPTQLKGFTCSKSLKQPNHFKIQSMSMDSILESHELEEQSNKTPLLKKGQSSHGESSQSSSFNNQSSQDSGISKKNHGIPPYLDLQLVLREAKINRTGTESERSKHDSFILNKDITQDDIKDHNISDSNNAEVDDDSYFNFDGKNMFSFDARAKMFQQRRHNSDTNEIYEKRSSLSNNPSYRFGNLEQIEKPRKASDHTVQDDGLRSLSSYRKDFGSPVPANKILLPFQRLKKQNSVLPKTGEKSLRSWKKQHRRQPSDSCFPAELIQKSQNPMKMSVYRNMNLHIFHSINIIKQIKEKPQIPEENRIDFKFKKPGFKKLIIFDLDETLIHCQKEDSSDGNQNDSDFDKEEGYQYKTQPNIWIDIQDPTSNEPPVKTGFFIRPYAIECLKQANINYEVAIFTGGQDWYANPIIDYIDPNHELVQHRYFRQHAQYLEDQGFFVKNLEILNGVNLKDVLIVDNYVYSFAFHLENGIPIVPFFGETDDIEMVKVISYLKHIHNRDDLREPNDKIFQLKKILNSTIDTFIKYYNFDVISDLDRSDEDREEDIMSVESHDFDQEDVDKLEINLGTDDQENMYSDKIFGERGGTIEDLDADTCDNCGIYKSSTMPTKKRDRYLSRIGSFNQQYNNPVKLPEEKKLQYSSSSLKHKNRFNTEFPPIDEEIPVIIKPPCHNRNKSRLQYNKMNSRKSQPSLSKDIETDLSNWQKAYEKVWENGHRIERQTCKNNNSTKSKFVLQKNLSFPVDNRQLQDLRLKAEQNFNLKSCSNKENK